MTTTLRDRIEELKGCPFCGGEAEIERPGTARQSMIIACTECDCRVESGDVVGQTKPELYRWNRRPAIQQVVAESAGDEGLEALIAECADSRQVIHDEEGTRSSLKTHRNKTTEIGMRRAFALGQRSSVAWGEREIEAAADATDGFVAHDTASRRRLVRAVLQAAFGEPK